MNGIQFITDEKGRKMAAVIDLKKHGRLWQDFWDGLVSESSSKGKGTPCLLRQFRHVVGEISDYPRVAVGDERLDLNGPSLHTKSC